MLTQRQTYWVHDDAVQIYSVHMYCLLFLTVWKCIAAPTWSDWNRDIAYLQTIKQRFHLGLGYWALINSMDQYFSAMDPVGL